MVDLSEMEGYFTQNEQANGNGKRTKSGSSTQRDIEGYLGDRLLRIKDKNGNTVYEIICINDPSHDKGEAAVYEYADGKLGASCKHNSCQGKHSWKDVKHALGKPPWETESKKQTQSRQSKPNGGVGKKIPASEVDPAVHVENFIDSIDLCGLPGIRRWRGQWYRYQDGRYVPITDEDLESRALLSIKSGYANVTGRVVGNVLRQLLAELNLDSNMEPHEWIGKCQMPGEMICFRNAMGSVGMIERGETIPATPAFFNLNATNFDFKPRHECPPPKAWIKFLGQVFDCPETIRTLKQFMGLCLTTDTSQQKMLFLLGPKRSGKGTVGRVLKQLIGDNNCCSPTLSGFATNFGLQPLIGKQVGIIADARISGRTNRTVITERLLSISGEDSLTVDRKYKEAWTGKFGIRIVVMSNELPSLQDPSGALPSRFIVLRMPNTYYGNEDHHLIDKLTGEIDSIFWWAFDGLLDLRKEGRLHVPKSSMELTKQFETLSSPLKSFIESNIKITGNPDDFVETDELYNRYERWRLSEGIMYKSIKDVFIKDFLVAANHVPEVKTKRDKRPRRSRQFKVVTKVRFV